jgi:hypothetical protein
LSTASNTGIFNASAPQGISGGIRAVFGTLSRDFIYMRATGLAGLALIGLGLKFAFTRR